MGRGICPVEQMLNCIQPRPATDFRNLNKSLGCLEHASFGSAAKKQRACLRPDKIVHQRCTAPSQHQSTWAPQGSDIKSLQDEEIIVFFNTSCTKLGIPDPVQAVRVVRDSASQLGKGFGFVQFSSQQAARAALGCDGQLLRKRPLRVTKAMKVSANLKQLGQKKSGQRQERRPESSSSGGRPASDAGVWQGAV